MGFKKICLLLLVLFFLIQCSPKTEKMAKGTIIINYQLNNVEGLEPSYQTAIWLEDVEGNYIRSLFVSEYLSYGGYNNPKICTNWIRLADWGKVSAEIFDAVTTATPPVGQNKLVIDCEKENLFAGKYRYCVQTHVIEDYNILYRGEIEIGGKDDKNIAELKSMPNRHPKAAKVLENVKAVYKP